MSDSDNRLFLELVAASTALATVADNYATVRDEKFDQMVRPQIDAVKAILKVCPSASFQWTGKLEDDDLEIKYYARARDEGGQAGHVQVLHKPSGIGRESYTKITQAENEEVARKHLEKAVREYYE